MVDYYPLPRVDGVLTILSLTGNGTGCRKETVPALYRIFEIDSLCDTLFSFLSPGTIVRLSRTCYDARQAVKTYFQRTYDINAHLSRFFDSPVSFRSLQAATGAIISGSNALQFMERCFYPEADLDVYVERKLAACVGDWIMTVHAGKGYQFAPRSDQKEGFADAVKRMPMSLRRSPEQFSESTCRGYTGDIADVFSFIAESFVDGKPANLQIQLIATEIAPAHAILDFHSTTVMNAITFKAAYSFYPEATFEYHWNLVCVKQPYPSRTKAALGKYVSRGYIQQEGFLSGFHPPTSSFHFGRTRWVGDAMCWTIPFSVDDIFEGLKPSMNDATADRLLSNDPFTNNGWILGRCIQDKHPEISYSLLEDRVFQYNYIIPNVCSRKVRILLWWGQEFLNILHVLKDAAGPAAASQFNPVFFDDKLAMVRNTCIEKCRCSQNDGAHSEVCISVQDIGWSDCPANEAIVLRLKELTYRSLAIC